MSAHAEWENITEEPFTRRLKVEGGWLYHVWQRDGPAMVFVPQIIAAPQDEYNYGNMHRLCDILDRIADRMDPL